jgi:benzoate-CoA ligase family protein
MAPDGLQRSGAPLTLEDIPREFNVASWFLDRQVQEGAGDRTALFSTAGDATYGELAALTNRIGHVLKDAGVRPEDRVLLTLGDGVEFVASWYAVLKIGAVTAEAYTFLQAKDFAYYLEYTRARAVIADGTTLERMREARAQSRWEHTLLVTGVAADELREGELSFDGLVAAAPEDLDAAPTSRDDIAIWKFTTGTTGRPKAAVHPHAAPRLSFDWYGRGVLDLQRDDVVLPVPKLFFGYARDLTALFSFGAGGAGVVFGERTTPARIFDLVERYRPTILATVPTMMRQMLAAPDAAERDLSSLRFCTSAGEALPAPLLARWVEAFGVEVLDGLGSSEAYHVYISQHPGQARPGRLGRLVPGYSARLLGADGGEVEPGGDGELWLRGATAAMMYWGDRPKSFATFQGDVVRTGDLLSCDADGYFTYKGRADDLLKVGGIYVAPAEVEGCLLTHDGVSECAVAGVERDGLVLTCAYVVASVGEDAGDDLAEGLRAHVRHHLSPHKYPREIVFLPSLPKTASGKIDRSALRALAVRSAD